MTAVREEIFGPVIVVVPFDDDDEAIAIANDSDYGLYDYVFSEDTAKAYGIAQQLEAGHVGINTAQRNHEAPFGGFKMSGVGRDGGDFGPVRLHRDPEHHLARLTTTTGCVLDPATRA